MMRRSFPVALAVLIGVPAGIAVSGCATTAQSAPDTKEAQNVPARTDTADTINSNDYNYSDNNNSDSNNGNVVIKSQSTVVVNGKIIRSEYSESGAFDTPPRIVEKTVPAESVQTVEVRSTFGGIEIKPADNSAQITIHAEITLSESGMSEADRKKYLAGFTVETETRGETLRIYAKPPARFPKRQGFGAAFRIGVPQGAGLALDAQTSNGAITVGETKTTGNVLARSDFGQITVQNAGIGAKIRAVTSNGSVEVENRAPVQSVSAHSDFGAVTVSGGGDIEARTSNGAVTISGTPQRVTGKSDFGAVSCTLAKGSNPQFVDLSTSNGSVSLTVPQGASLRIAARTSSGSISTNGINGKTSGGSFSKSFVGTLGAGKTPAELYTDFGSISITAR